MALGLLGIFAISAVLSIIIIVIGIGLYVYTALAYMALAKRTNTPHRWMAWVPYIQFYLVAKIARKSGWPILLLIIPFILSFFSQNIIITIISYLVFAVFAIFAIVWWWDICKIRGKPGWWALIMIVPLVGGIWALIMIGILAWGKDKAGSAVPTPTTTASAPQTIK